MTQEAYCSFEVSKLLREKGFECEKSSISAMYNEISNFYSLNTSADDYYDYEDFDEYDYIAPTLQLALAWLRDIHNIDIIAPPQFDNSKWTYSAIIVILSVPCAEIRLIDNKDKKEEAIEAALKYTLENLI